MDHAWLSAGELGLVVERIIHDDYQIARMNEVRGGTVDADDAAASWRGNDIGFEASAVGDVDDCHLLAFDEVGGVKQVGVDCNRADVMQVGLRHRRTVDLRLHHDPHH